MLIVGVDDRQLRRRDDDAARRPRHRRSTAPRPRHRRHGTDGTGGEPVEGAEITIALGSEPTSLDPHLVDDGGERAINDNIYETLLTRTPDGELAPGLATELPTQVDDTTWEFTLREGVTFHNGDAVQRRLGGRDDRAHGRPRRARRDRQRRLLRHARPAPRRSTTTRCGS